MIKLEYIIGAGLVLLWMRGNKKQAASTQLQDTMSSQQGSDWIGVGGLYDMWDRLSGSDLVVKGYPNLTNSAVADPGKIGTIQTGILPAWDGSIATAAAK